jgi:hypothetical protein
MLATPFASRASMGLGRMGYILSLTFEELA